MNILDKLKGVLPGNRGRDKRAFGVGRWALDEEAVRRALELKKLGFSDRRVAQMVGINRGRLRN